MWLRAVASAATLLLIAGCGTLNGPRTGTISPPADALARWNDFPAGQVPRPIVLFDTFVTTHSYALPQDKLAALCGKFVQGFQPAPDVPPQAVATWANGANVGYPAISASAAYSAMVDRAVNRADPACATATPVTISAARFTVARFETDRGLAQMSAWSFSAASNADQFAYPSLVSTAFWQGGAITPSIGDRATVSADGRTLTFSFPGGPTDGPCAADYTGVPAESSHAVAVAVQSSPGRPQGGPNSCDLTGTLRFVTVALASPLDGRVVVDASGAAVAVCPEAAGTAC